MTAVRPLAGSYCAVCGEDLRLPANSDLVEVRCLLCQRVDPPFERAVAYGSYESELRELIHLLKFQQVRPAADVLGRMLAEPIARLEPAMPVGSIAVIPVPLHRRKRRQRGFNQAELIARSALKQMSRAQMSRSNRFELCTGVLARLRETGSQIGLNRHQRRKNLRGAFAVSDAKPIMKRGVLLVDDVLTTGTTASECATVLLRAGAARVWVATVARTLKVSQWNLSDLGSLGQNSENDSPQNDLPEEEIQSFQKMTAKA